LRPRTRSARSSATSKTTASSGALSQMKVTTQSLQASLPCMMQPSHSIVSVAMPTGSREPVTKTLPRRWEVYGKVTIVVPGGGAKVDAGGFAV